MLDNNNQKEEELLFNFNKKPTYKPSPIKMDTIIDGVSMTNKKAKSPLSFTAFSITLLIFCVCVSFIVLKGFNSHRE